MKPTMRGLRRRAIAVLTALGLAGPLGAQQPSTRAERSDWLETSRYRDVVAFLDSLGSPVLHRTTFGYTFEGRALPLVVVGRELADGSPESVRATGRTRVLVFANIHGGEVEGKEATQMLLRRFAEGRHADWLDSLVLLIAPIYNADGNDRVAVTHRYRQNGPLGGVGQRANAQKLDLNRDHMKLESPEARSLVRLLGAYDPHLVVDLHTTNGTPHAYHLTYSPPLHPDTHAGITELLRDRLLPAVTRSIRERRGWHFYYYGNAYTPAGGEPGWYTFDHRPRFNNNYVGLRNRVAILSEAFAYASFRERVMATLAFVEEILAFAHRHAGEIDRIVRAADGQDVRGRRLALRSTFERGEPVEILMGATEERLSPFSGRRYRARLDVARADTMREYGTFVATEQGSAPDVYYVPAELAAVTDLLEFHGVRTHPLESERVLALERFVIDSTTVAEREFQGHHVREVFGRWVEVERRLPVGTVAVPVDQPLGRLVFHLLEPRADDGVVAWNLVDSALEEEPSEYPILRRPLPEEAAEGPRWVPRPAPTDAELRGLSAAPGGVAWATGRGGVWAVTDDGGHRWRTGVIPGADSLFLVDVHAIDARRAVVLGTHFDGGLARIYRTDDGGGRWDLAYEDDRPGAFYDGLAFWDETRGVAFGDALDGALTIVRTLDGRRWEPAAAVPRALEGEGGFAASGTAIAVAGDRHAWIGTGAGPRARVLRTRDGGRTWAVAETPLPAGPTAGIFGVAFRDTLHGVAVGGDYTDTTGTAVNVIRTRDGGRTWQLAGRTEPPGVRYGVAWTGEAEGALVVAVGPSGSGYSPDGGGRWVRVGETGYNAVAFTGEGEGWAAGVRGQVARWRLGPFPEP